MKLVIFGLTVSSSWGNGHATLWRGLCKSLGKRGHTVVFYERDVPYYSSTRDIDSLPGGGELVLYSNWNDIAVRAKRDLNDAEVGMVSSYCPDARQASDLILDSQAELRVFYDLDSPVTLARLSKGETVDWVGSSGYRDFDLVLSYAGGDTLPELQRVLGAKRVAPLYGSVDPEVHKPSPSHTDFKGTVSYLGTYSADRDEALRKLLLEPARRLPERRFVIAGSMYGGDFPWLDNIFFINHLPPAQHPAFYCSSKVTLNVTREPMAISGFCPSGRLFEAAACGVPVFSDSWEGLDSFYQPGAEILVGRTSEEAVDILNRSPEELAGIGRAARERTLADHTADKRVEQLEAIFESAARPAKGGAQCGA